MSRFPAPAANQTLAAARVSLTWPKTQFDYRIFTPGDGEPAAPYPAEPLVSCLMVTRGETALIRYALLCYRAQTWVRRELVVVTDLDRAAAVGEIARELQLPEVRVFGAPKRLRLGDLRNLAVARARGDIIMQWDDDDLSDPMRIAVSVKVLAHTDAAAAFLSRWIIWWPGRRVAAVSSLRAWEGSIAVWKDQARLFPALALGEDSPPSEALRRHHPIVLIDDPTLYVYAITGRNTFGETHFDALLEACEWVFRDEEFQVLTDRLAMRLPIRDYQSFLTDGS